MTKTYRILSIEDDQDLFALIQIILKELPVTMRRAGTGEEALALIAEARPDLVLLDLALPDMRGWDVLDRAAANGNLDGVPVVVLTSHSELPHRVVGKMQEVAAYIRKPFTPADLRDSVRRLLGLS